MALLSWILFPLLTLAAVVFIGPQVFYTLLFELPWTVRAVLAGQLKARAIAVQMSAAAFWAVLVGLGAFLAARVAPGPFNLYISHPGTTLGLLVGAFWLVVGAFSGAARQERADNRLKYLAHFGKLDGEG